MLGRLGRKIELDSQLKTALLCGENKFPKKALDPSKFDRFGGKQAAWDQAGHIGEVPDGESQRQMVVYHAGRLSILARRNRRRNHSKHVERRAASGGRELQYRFAWLHRHRPAFFGVATQTLPGGFFNVT